MEIREATMEDAKLLFAWRNDELTRAMSRNTEPVSWSGHVVWLAKRLGRKDPSLYVAILDGAPVATYRIDDGFLSYTVAPEHRGKGIGGQLLKLIHEKHGPQKAEIKRANEASIKIAKRANHDVVLID